MKIPAAHVRVRIEESVRERAHGRDSPEPAPYRGLRCTHRDCGLVWRGDDRESVTHECGHDRRDEVARDPFLRVVRLEQHLGRLNLPRPHQVIPTHDHSRCAIAACFLHLRDRDAYFVQLRERPILNNVDGGLSPPSRPAFHCAPGERGKNADRTRGRRRASDLVLLIAPPRCKRGCPPSNAARETRCDQAASESGDELT